MTGLDTRRVTQTVTDASRRLSDAAAGMFLRRETRDDGLDEWTVSSISRPRGDSTTEEITLPSLSPALRRALATTAPTRFDDAVRVALFSADVIDVIAPDGGPLHSCLVAPVRSRDVDDDLLVLFGEAIAGGVHQQHRADDVARAGRCSRGRSTTPRASSAWPNSACRSSPISA